MSSSNDIYSCPPLNGTHLITNTSDTSNGTFVAVSCDSGFQVSSLALHGQQPNVFQCFYTVWLPSKPNCVAGQSSTIPIGAIVGSTVGGVICILFIALAAYIMFRSRNDGKLEKQHNQLQQAKNMHIDFFMSSFQRDAVGMPAIVPDAMDSDLRGISQTLPASRVEPLSTPADPYSTNLSRTGSHHSSMESITSAGDMEEDAKHNRY